MLYGECVDCGEDAQLRYKPDVPRSEQSRPSICWQCHDRREELMEASQPDRRPPEGHEYP